MAARTGTIDRPIQTQAGTVYGLLLEAGMRAKSKGNNSAAKAYGLAAQAVRGGGNLIRQVSGNGRGLQGALKPIGDALGQGVEFLVDAAKRGGKRTRKAGAAVLQAGRTAASAVGKTISKTQDAAILWRLVALVGAGLFLTR